MGGGGERKRGGEFVRERGGEKGREVVKRGTRKGKLI